MHDVAILGAGELGGAIAHMLARTDMARAIRLIDETETIATGKALDIMQAAPLERFSTRLSGHRDTVAAVGASVVVIADDASVGEWNVETGLMPLRRLLQSASGSLLLFAGASQRELIERGVRELGIPRAHAVGSAPEALAAAARAIIALETGGSPGDVALTVLGVPPSHVVVPWEEVTVAGLAATHVLDEPARRRLVARITALWPPGPLTLAAAASRVIAVLLGRSLRTVSAFVAPDDTYGRRTRAAALPVRLGPAGVLRVERPTLNAHDRTALDNATLL